MSLENIHDYRFASNGWVYDPRPSPEQEAAKTAEERIAKLEEENAYLKETLEIILSGNTGEVAADG